MTKVIARKERVKELVPIWRTRKFETLDVDIMDQVGNTRFIQASLCKIQGLFKDFLKTFLLFSRSENL